MIPLFCPFENVRQVCFVFCAEVLLTEPGKEAKQWHESFKKFSQEDKLFSCQTILRDASMKVEKYLSTEKKNTEKKNRKIKHCYQGCVKLQ